MGRSKASLWNCPRTHHPATWWAPWTPGPNCTVPKIAETLPRGSGTATPYTRHQFHHNFLKMKILACAQLLVMLTFNSVSHGTALGPQAGALTSKETKAIIILAHIHSQHTERAFNMLHVLKRPHYKFYVRVLLTRWQDHKVSGSLLFHSDNDIWEIPP